MMTMEALREKSRRQKAERRQRTAEERTEALRRGKEDLDLAALALLRTLKPRRPEPPDDIAFHYFVESPKLMTMAELARELDELTNWSD